MRKSHQHVDMFSQLYISTGVDGKTVDMFNLVDIQNEVNLELAVKISTDVQNSEREFFTDLNGFQVRGTQHISKPLTKSSSCSSDKRRKVTTCIDICACLR